MRQRGQAELVIGFACLLTTALVVGNLAPIPVQGHENSEHRIARPYVAPKGYVCYRADSPIQIDGVLDEADWQNAAWTDDFVDIEVDRKPQPRFRTRAKMLWDDQFLYIAAEMTEPHVWGTHTKHDAVIFEDNDFEVFIDPNGDNHEYYEFEMNALNTGWDLLLPRPYKDGGRAVNGWEIAGLQKAVSVDGSLNHHRDTDRGWSIELAFPWAVLGELAYSKSPPQDKDQWRINFSRVEWQHEIFEDKYRKVPQTKEDNWVWSPQGVIDMHRPETWGFVQFSTGKPGTVEFQADDAGPTRHQLHEVYYAQQDFRKKHRHWADSLQELGFNTENSESSEVKLSVAGELFEAISLLTRRDGKQEKWHIRQDSRIWKD